MDGSWETRGKMSHQSQEEDKNRQQKCSTHWESESHKHSNRSFNDHKKLNEIIDVQGCNREQNERKVVNILYTNAQSIVNKIDELKIHVSELKPDIILICEAWTHEEITNAYLHIDGYSLESRVDRKDTTDGRGGGLLAYFKLGMKPLPIDDVILESFNQCLGLKIPWNKSDVISLMLAYRTHKRSGDDNSNTLRLCEAVKSLSGSSLVIGDINLPGIDWGRMHSDAAGKEFFDTIQDCFMEQLVDFPTHDSGSTLDLVISSSPDLVSSVQPVGKLGSSDHVMMMIQVCGMSQNNTSFEMVPDWKNTDWDKLNETLSTIDWLGNLERKSGIDGWDFLKQTLDTATEHCIPKKKRRVSHKPIWMTRNVLRVVRKKRRLWKTYTTTNDYAEFQAYKHVENEVKKAVRNAKRKFERTLAKNAKKNPKGLFSYLKKKRNNKESVGPLKDSTGATVTDDSSMANVLNCFFSSVFTEEDLNNLPVPKKMYHGNNPLNRVEFSEELVKEKLVKLKLYSAPGPDGLWPRVIHNLADVLSIPLAIIYRKCLEEKTVPKDWKLANITPIFKKNNKSDPGNYRPISLTCILCKVMEGIVRDAIILHLVENKLVNSSQHGFMSGRSCLTNLLEFLETLTDLVDQGHSVDIVYLDFAKAFDKVPHRRLATKCEAHGISGDILEWIIEWLSGRKQRVVLNGKCSNWNEVISGVPQGSVLGPTLFLLYINDIDFAIDLTHSTIKKFADDTKIAMVVESEEDRLKFQSNLDRLVKWSEEWQMLFNIDKCHIMHLGKKNPLYTYSLKDNDLEVVEQEKDVGVIVHDSLKPSVQCAQAAKKANQVLGQLCRAITFRDKNTFLRLYCIYVRPHLEYAVQAWSPWNEEDKQLLEQVQKRAIRMISGLKGTYEQKLKQLGLTTLVDRRIRGDMIEVYKILTGKEVVSYESWFEMASDDKPGMPTRNTTGYLNVARRKAHLDIRRYFFSLRIWHNWNILDDYVKLAPTTVKFKERYDMLIQAPAI